MEAWVVVRVRPNGTEEIIQTVSTVGLTPDQIEEQRPDMLTIVRNLRAQQAGRHYVLYCPNETSPDRVWDDVCWDSAFAE